MSSSLFTPLVFTGVSTYSSDFQQILTRAVSIAQLPITSLQNDQSTLLAKKQSLTGLQTNLQSLEDAVTALGNLGSSGGLTATSSNSNEVSVQLNGATSANSYTITNITSVAAKASETTANGFADADKTAASASGTAELVLGNNTYTLDLNQYGNNLNGLRDAINASGAAVTASVLNTGNATNPYYLSVTANNTGATTLKLRTTPGDDQSNILTTTNQGANAVFDLNGLPFTKTDNVISDAVPGLTFTIQGTTSPNESVVLQLSSDRGALATGIQNFVTAYNAAVTAVNAQVGTNAGPLSGDSIVTQIKGALSQLTGYSTSGAVQSLFDLGFTLDKTGVASFDSTQFYSLPSSTIDSAFQFLGSATTGFGGLSQTLGQIADPTSGLIKTQQDLYDTSDQRISDQISTLTDRVTLLQTTLSQSLQQADALVASLTSQQNLLTASINSLNLATFGKQTTQ